MKIVYYITNLLLILSALAGVANGLFNGENYIQQMGQLGYPDYLRYILPLFQFAGGLVIGLSLLKVNFGRYSFLIEWAYAGFFIQFVGAILSHVFNQDGQFMPALIALIIFEIAYFSKKKVEKSF